MVTCGGNEWELPQADSHARNVDPGCPTEIRVNAGAGALSLSAEWEADAHYLGGQTLELPGSVPIAGTADDELYRSERSADSATPTLLSYRVPVEDGPYRVTLHFAEIYWSAPGERVFDVVVEGVPQLVGYDIVAEVGPLAASVETFDVAVEDGFLDVHFLAQVDRPKVAALEIVELPAGTFGNYCEGQPNAVGPGASMGFTGSVSLAEDHFLLTADGLPPWTFGWFLVAAEPGYVPLVGKGTFCLGASFAMGPLQVALPEGTAVLPLPLGAAAFAPGSSWSFQFAYLDLPLPSLNLSDGLSVRFTP